MQMRVVITEDGRISVFADKGTFDEGKDKIEIIMKALNAQGLIFEEQSPVEAHRHEDELVLASGKSHRHA